MDEEDTAPKLGWDHQTFLVDGQPFYPDLSESGNTILVRLPCGPHSELNWEIPSTSKRIIWEFVCGLDEPFFPFTDELRFQALSLACKQFTQTLWPRYKDQTLGGILYRGPADISPFFLWNDLQKANYASITRPNQFSDFPGFCLDVLYSYVQLLAYLLPDELPLMLCFDVKMIPSLSRALSLLSRERFNHFLIAVSSNKWPMPAFHYDEHSISFLPLQASKGLCFPKASQMNEETFFHIDKIIKGLYESNSSFRVIFEEYLTEQWDHLDEILVLPQALSAQGRRKLAGFKAAGGSVLEIE